MSDGHTQGIKKSIEDIIGSDTVLKLKKKGPPQRSEAALFLLLTS